jgi:hypothetical protein
MYAIVPPAGVVEVTNIVHVRDGNAAALGVMITDNNGKKAPPRVRPDKERRRKFVAGMNLIEPLACNITKIPRQSRTKIGRNRPQRSFDSKAGTAADVAHLETVQVLAPHNNALGFIGTETHVTNRDGGLGTGGHLLNGIGMRLALLRGETRGSRPERCQALQKLTALHRPLLSNARVEGENLISAPLPRLDIREDIATLYTGRTESRNRTGEL